MLSKIPGSRDRSGRCSRGPVAGQRSFSAARRLRDGRQKPGLAGRCPFILGRRLFEESNLTAIHRADPATIKLMGYPQTLRGHVNSGARAITVADAQPDQVELASVDPIFTWVRLPYRWGAKRRDPLSRDDSDPCRSVLSPKVGKVDHRPTNRAFNQFPPPCGRE